MHNIGMQPKFARKKVFDHFDEDSVLLTFSDICFVPIEAIYQSNHNIVWHSVYTKQLPICLPLKDCNLVPVRSDKSFRDEQFRVEHRSACGPAHRIVAESDESIVEYGVGK